MNRYQVIGLMSGTSLDGLDIAYCEFFEREDRWEFKIDKAETIEYNDYWKNSLIKANELPTQSFLKLHNEYGEYIGEQVNIFIKKQSVKPLIISSHGHTIFHQPENGFTFQIGNGASIAAKTKITTISDFRTFDIALGGQGAPLVPIGDKLLFPDYEYCLNLGGFANISFTENDLPIAFDVCPCNIVINYLANKINLQMDRGGEIAKKGAVDDNLIGQLNQLPYYSKIHPKSLGKEWLDSIFIPVIEKTHLSFSYVMRTIYEHISLQISKVITKKISKTLVTGGGAKNDYLMFLLKEKIKGEVIIPDDNIINFKEALIFAFLGLLRYQGQNNCLASVTGASRDCSGGVVYVP